MKEQVDGNKKEQRSQKLIELSDENEKEYNEKYVGQTVEVLFEEEKDGIYKGHTKNYIQVYLVRNQSENFENRIVEVVCDGAEINHIMAKI